MTDRIAGQSVLLTKRRDKQIECQLGDKKKLRTSRFSARLHADNSASALPCGASTHQQAKRLCVDLIRFHERPKRPEAKQMSEEALFVFSGRDTALTVKMNLTLYRKICTARSTIGELYVNKAFFCFVLEDPLRQGPKVYGQTAIPAGTYSIALTYSNRFKTTMPLLLNVPGFEGIRIHPGNTPENTLGCLLVGRKHGQDWIGESREAYRSLFELLDEAKAKEKITIEIVNPPTSPVQTHQIIPAQPLSPPVRAQALTAEALANPPMRSDALNDEETFSTNQQTSLGQRLGVWIDSMDTSRLIGVLSFIATVTFGASALLGDFDPVLAAKLMTISGGISAFCGRLQGVGKGNQ